LCVRARPQASAGDLAALLATTDGGRDALHVATGDDGGGGDTPASGGGGASSLMSAGDRAAHRAVMDALRGV
jgi:hypothetical protein